MEYIIPLSVCQLVTFHSCYLYSFWIYTLSLVFCKPPLAYLLYANIYTRGEVAHTKPSPRRTKSTQSSPYLVAIAARVPLGRGRPPVSTSSSLRRALRPSSCPTRVSSPWWSAAWTWLGLSFFFFESLMDVSIWLKRRLSPLEPVSKYRIFFYTYWPAQRKNKPMFCCATSIFSFLKNT